MSITVAALKDCDTLASLYGQLRALAVELEGLRRNSPGRRSLAGAYLQSLRDLHAEATTLNRAICSLAGMETPGLAEAADASARAAGPRDD